MATAASPIAGRSFFCGDSIEGEQSPFPAGKNIYVVAVYVTRGEYGRGDLASLIDEKIKAAKDQMVQDLNG